MPFFPPPALPPPIILDATWTVGTPAGTWSGGALPVRFALAREGTRDVGTVIAGELDVAIRTWTLPACTAWRAVYAGVDARAAADDGVNVVVVHEDAWPPELVAGAVAQTVIHVDANGRYRDADIHLNGVDHRFSLDAAKGTLDLRSVLVHELGHALGLGHAVDVGATMAPAGSGLRWRSLESSDVEGVCTLYPGVGAPGCPDDACPSGFVCAARRCQRPGELTAICAPCDPEQVGTCEAAGDLARCAELAPGGPRACARPCGQGEDCGPGYTCRPTSGAGDLQCVADDGCRTAGLACDDAGSCVSGTCTSGVCLGPAAADAGARAIPPPPSPGAQAPPDDGGCTCTTANGTASLAPWAVAALAWVVARCRRARSSL